MRPLPIRIKGTGNAQRDSEMTRRSRDNQMSTNEIAAVTPSSDEGLTDGPERRYLTIPEFASYSTLSESTIRRLIRDGKLSVSQPGGKHHRVLIARDALEKNHARPSHDSEAIRKREGESDRSHVHSSNHSTLRGPKPRWAQPLA